MTSRWVSSAPEIADQPFNQSTLQYTAVGINYQYTAGLVGNDEVTFVTIFVTVFYPQRDYALKR
jgi:hypothetical protein